MKFVCREGQYVAEHLGEVIHTTADLYELLDNFMPSDDFEIETTGKILDTSDMRNVESIEIEDFFD